MDIMQVGNKILNEQPFSRLLGARLERLQPGFAQLELDIKPEFLQQHGYVHGGVISYLADNALTFAGGSLFGDALTVEFKINYQRPAQGQRLIAKAKAEASGKKVVCCTCEIYCLNDAEEFLCASAQGTVLGKV
ncbi:hotdog fold thioesterase [Hahella sp. KA22]|uniref:PaaI family thioesterase n=1 Tax=Hahella sp. KA22 TaxID=1628392 RepID=UPI000FDDC4E7|nr:PaaI family thioesterase [Hahella sp. KA22]AZZ90584.1 PaaI family thioesterase [Hahella sp. KA22]QAY53954.1 hotdog fold thioesterase [Hahella sp. KA22]